MGAHIPGITHTDELEECLLAELRSHRWRFEAARDCNREPVPGEYTADVALECSLQSQKRG